MSEPGIDRKIQLFRSLFKGRKDVFATRWEIPANSPGGEGKSGYMPAYLYNPYRYRAHKMKGGTSQSYADKKYLPLTDEQANITWFITAWQNLNFLR